MKYRIAIGNIIDNAWVFSHYANNELMLTLRVSNDGIVQGLLDSDDAQQYLQNGDCAVACFDFKCPVLYYWYDLSKTHKVEYGLTFDIGDVYEGDIIQYNILDNEYQLPDPVNAPWYRLCIDTVIKTIKYRVVMNHGILYGVDITKNMTLDSSQELQDWNIASHSILLHSRKMTKLDFILQLPNQKYDELLILYLLLQSNTISFLMLLLYLSPKIIEKVHK